MFKTITITVIVSPCPCEMFDLTVQESQEPVLLVPGVLVLNWSVHTMLQLISPVSLSNCPARSSLR